MQNCLPSSTVSSVALTALTKTLNERQSVTGAQRILEQVLPGTALPAALQRTTRGSKRQAAVQTAVTAFLSSIPADLQVLQQADQTIGTFLHFWHKQRVPNQAERVQLSHRVHGLVRQWNCIVQVEGLLYRRFFRPDGGEEVYQLFLQEDLKDEVLHQLQQNHSHEGSEWNTELVRQRFYWPRMDQKMKE